MVFAAVVRHGGITAAGRELGMAKSVVSNLVTRLEQRLNVKLLNRQSRRVSLTKQGEALLPGVESLIAEGEQLFALAEQEEAQPRGLVRIAATPEFAQWLLVHFIAEVNRRLPEIQLVLKTAYNFEDLQDPSFDLAFRINRVKDERLVARKLGDFHRQVFAHPSLPKPAGFDHPSHLPQLPCLGFSDGTGESLWRFQTLHTGAGEHLDIAVQTRTAVRSFNVLAELAALGQGACMVPSFVARRHLQAGTLERLLPQWQSPASPVYLVYRRGAERIARVNAVLDIARQFVPSLIEQLQ